MLQGESSLAVDKEEDAGTLERPRKTPYTSNTDFMLAMFLKIRQEAECILILGTFVELVDKETVLKQKELSVNTVIVVLKNKSEYVPQVHTPLL